MRICVNYCNLEMPEALNKVLMLNQDQKSMKTPFVTYADT